MLNEQCWNSSSEIQFTNLSKSQRLIFHITNNGIIRNETPRFLSVFIVACRPDTVNIKYERYLCSDATSPQSCFLYAIMKLKMDIAN